MDSIISRIESIRELINEIPELKDLIASTNSKIETIEAHVKKNRLELLDLEKEIVISNNSTERINRVISDLQQNEFSIDSVSMNSNLVDLIKQLEKKNKTLLSEERKLESVNSDLKQQQDLNKTIRKFIEAGLTIVNERKNSICPLCEHVFNSYSELADKISNNTALSGRLKQLFQDQNRIISNITIIEEDLARGKELLNTFYNLDIAETKGKRDAKQKLYDDIKAEIDELNSQLKLLKITQTEQRVKTTGLAVEDYEKLLLAQYDDLNASKILLA